LARTDARFRLAHNRLLGRLADLPLGAKLMSEVKLAADLAVSRTVVRAVLARFAAAGIVQIIGRDKTLLRRPVASDALALRDDYISREALEAQFLDWVLRFDVPAGTTLNVTQLSRQFNVPPHLLAEFLASLSQSGLVERRPRGGWRLLGFTADYALDLSEFRQVLELHAIRHLVTLPPAHPLWAGLSAIKAEHLALWARLDHDFHAVSALDARFHALINSAVPNRFMTQFQNVIRLIFHYHYQWDKTLERVRNEAAIREHLQIIAALEARDATAAVQAATQHLTTAKAALLQSLRGARPEAYDRQIGAE
jgi:DNA-binding GntR family transcriptional regulator